MSDNTLFQLPDSLPALPERWHDMIRAYGRCDTEICKTCVHLIKHTSNGHKHFIKCALSPITFGAGTDWRVRWPACGKWEARKE
jgi:hypothetical protein